MNRSFDYPVRSFLASASLRITTWLDFALTRSSLTMTANMKCAHFSLQLRTTG